MIQQHQDATIEAITALLATKGMRRSIDAVVPDAGKVVDWLLANSSDAVNKDQDFVLRCRILQLASQQGPVNNTDRLLALADLLYTTAGAALPVLPTPTVTTKKSSKKKSSKK